MAIRNIRVIGDEILRKKCKEVKEITEKNKELIQDMLDTMYDADGVGLAAPQVGILKRIAVIDVSETRDQPIVLINPVVKDAKGEQTDMEGCLSVPEKAGQVTRPMKVKVETYDMDMKKTTVKGEGLLARALLHEMDHLDGVLYVDKVEGSLQDVTANEEEQ